MSKLTKFEDLEIPALTEVAKESFEEALWATEKALAKQLEFGRVMLIVKSKLAYGEWGKWVRETFEDHLSLRTIQTHMKAHEAVAQNPALLECANSLDDILKATAKPLKPKVEVINVAASVPAVESDVVANEEQSSTEKVQRMFNVSEESVEQAAQILETATPEVIAAVDSGEMLLSEAIATVKPVVTKPARAKQKPAQQEERRDMLDIFTDLKQTVVDGMQEFPANQRAKIWPQLVEQVTEEHFQDVLMQIANEALYRLKPQDRGEVISKHLVSMPAEERGMIFATVEHLLKRKPATP